MASTDAQIEEFLDGWDELRDSGIVPRFESVLSDSREGRREFLVGAEMLGLNTTKKPLQPQQLRLADSINGGHTFNGILLPRRSSKTTSIFALFIGRCMEREDYNVGFTTATTGIKTRTRFMLDIVKPIQKLYPDEKTRPCKIVLSKGEERIEFPNGSSFQCLPPDGEKFRGDAYDAIIIDEGGEASPEMTEDLTEGYLPTLDTRPEATVVIAGTAPAYRKGNILWDTLEDGRNADERETGILEYSAPDDLTVDDLTGEDGAPSWELAMPHVLDSHPGIGTLTTIEVIERNFRKLKLAQFLREYLSVAPDLGGARGVLPAEAWATASRPYDDLPDAPAHFALAVGVHPLQASACVAAAWRDDEGRAVLLVLAHRPGVRWLVPFVKPLAQKRRMPIHYDAFGPMRLEAEALARVRPKLKLAEQRTHNVTTSAALVLKELSDANLVHYSQPALDDAVRIATKRKVGDKSWAFGRADDGDDIIALETVALALRAFDDLPKRESFASISAA